MRYHIVTEVLPGRVTIAILPEEETEIPPDPEGISPYVWTVTPPGRLASLLGDTCDRRLSRAMNKASRIMIDLNLNEAVIEETIRLWDLNGGSPLDEAPGHPPGGLDR